MGFQGMWEFCRRRISSKQKRDAALGCAVFQRLHERAARATQGCAAAVDSNSTMPSSA